MSEEITLEKIDILRERTGVSYTEAKEALEASNGNVVDALIYIEKNSKSTMESLYTTKDEFFDWLKDIIKKGNVNRIKIKKDEKIIVDIPVNAAIAASVTALVWPPLIAIGILTAVFTNVTIEITKTDGSVEVINKIIKTSVKDTVRDTVRDVKEKVVDAAASVKDRFVSKDEKREENTYQYTVKFEDMGNEDISSNTCNINNEDSTDNKKED
jgi:hypothetical protein